MSVQKKKQSMIGEVVSDKMKNTVVVVIKNKYKAPLYGKFVTRIQRIFAHDSNDQYKIGDRVVIEPCRPISKNKSWVVVKMLES